MHCDESECFGERVGKREDWEETDLDGAASLQEELVSPGRRDSRVSRLVACPKDGIVDDILCTVVLGRSRLQILKALQCGT